MCADELHLPFGQKMDVWHRYQDENKKGNEKCPKVSRTQFFKIWSQRCRFLKVRAFHRFALCSTCVEIGEELYRAKGANKQAWQEAKQHHFNDVSVFPFFSRFFFELIFFCCWNPIGKVKVERCSYHYRHQRCEDFRDAVHLVVDGQENSANSLLHFAVLDKFSSQGWQIKAGFCTSRYLTLM